MVGRRKGGGEMAKVETWKGEVVEGRMAKVE